MSSARHLTDLLRAARRRRHLTQGQLGRKVGLPQSHVSNIESGRVDLQVSNLIELARALDLEPMLVPRKLVPAIESLLRQASTPDAERQQRAYRLEDDDDDGV